MNKPEETYLGDGLYVSFDGFQFRLFTDRGFGNIHEIYLEPAIATRFIKFVEHKWGIKITISEARGEK